MMKLLLFFSTLCIFSEAYSCPKVTGHYSCKRFKAGYSITSFQDQGVWTFEINGESYIADGLERALERKNTDGTYFSACQDDENYFFHQEYTKSNNPTLQIENSFFSFQGGDLSKLYVDQEFLFGSDQGLALRIDDLCTLDEAPSETAP